jgi:F-type H+-transporting ATPase subunit a
LLNSHYILAASSNPLEHVVAHRLFSFDLLGYDVVVTNHMFMLTLSAVVLVIFLPFAVRNKGMVPKGFANLIESVCVFIREDVARPFLGDLTDKMIGFIWTLFFFLLTMNLLGMIPLGKLIFMVTGKPNHWEGTATANIWVVGALALVAFFATHVAGIAQQGFAGYAKNFAPHAPWPIMPFIIILEIIGALVKPFALAIRLFANMLAGHIIIASLLGFIFIFQSWSVGIGVVFGVVLMSFLELFVAFLQAYIFTFLTTIFISFAVKPEH